MDRNIHKALAPMYAFVVIACVLLLARRYVTAAIVVTSIGIVLLLLSFLLLRRYSKRSTRMMDDVFNYNSSVSTKLVNSINIPCLLFNGEGEVVWRNEAMAEIFDGAEIAKILPALNPRQPASAVSYEARGKKYQLINMPAERGGEAVSLTFQYWLDRTEALHYARLYDEQRPTIMLAYIDNYDELNADKDFQRGTVLSAVEKQISRFVSGIGGVYRRYDTARFFIVVDSGRIDELEAQKFELLDSVREIRTGTKLSATLSIAVGVADRLASSDEASRLAMELALGRGGDQAVVKRGSNYSFYGSARQNAVTRHSKVKVRLFSKALKQLLDSSSEVFIMGHKFPDMDCIGAAVGLARCANDVRCVPYIILEQSNAAIENSIKLLQDSGAFKNTFKTPEQALKMIKQGSVLIVIDTQRADSVISPQLYDAASVTVIIDHHRRSVETISTSALSYYDTAASSASEIVTEIMQYFDENISPSALECDMLLAGIAVDTKNFAFNTSARTFEAAGFLKKNGADPSNVKQMFQSDLDAYINCAKVVASAQILKKGIAVAVCDKDMQKPGLIAAQAADALISIKEIQASFVLAYANSQVLISGRSLGKINVQLILEGLGGGGHLTVAGAQLKGVTLEQAKKQLTEKISAYIKEEKDDEGAAEKGR